MGEATSSSAVASPSTQFHDTSPKTLWGVIEKAHVATMLTRDGEPADWPYLPPIGRPIPNLKAYILNDLGIKTPFGGIGEIYIGGAGLAAGYLNNDQLNAEKFVKNPYGVEMLYKTGDLGWWYPNGIIGFHGRADEQVKVRGYRVELGEVENTMRDHPDVISTCVILSHF